MIILAEFGGCFIFPSFEIRNNPENKANFSYNQSNFPKNDTIVECDK